MNNRKSKLINPAARTVCAIAAIGIMKPMLSPKSFSSADIPHDSGLGLILFRLILVAFFGFAAFTGISPEQVLIRKIKDKRTKKDAV